MINILYTNCPRVPNILSLTVLNIYDNCSRIKNSFQQLLNIENLNVVFNTYILDL